RNTSKSQSVRFTLGRPQSPKNVKTNSEFIVVRGWMRNDGTQPLNYDPLYSCRILTADGWKECHYDYFSQLERRLSNGQKTPLWCGLPPDTQARCLQLYCRDVITTQSVLGRIFGPGWWRLLAWPTQYALRGSGVSSNVESEVIAIRPDAKVAPLVL